jgi:hypothetical protein
MKTKRAERIFEKMTPEEQAEFIKIILEASYETEENLKQQHKENIERLNERLDKEINKLILYASPKDKPIMAYENLPIENKKEIHAELLKAFKKLIKEHYIETEIAKRKAICKEKGHEFTEWKLEEHNTVLPTCDNLRKHSGMRTTHIKYWYRICTRCDHFENVFEEPKDYKEINTNNNKAPYTKKK